MGASVKPESRIERRIAALKAQGASEADIETYLTEHEGLQPVQPAKPSVGNVDLRASSESASVRPNYMQDKKARAAAPAQFGTGLLRSVEQGAAMGFGDEINGGIRSLLTDQTYSDAVGDERKKLAAYKAANPGTALVSELGGGIGSMLVGGAALKGVGLAGKAAVTAKNGLAAAKAGAKAGGILGGLSGVGNADGDLGDRVQGGVVGGTIGSLIGGAAPSVVRGASTAVGKGITALGLRPTGRAAAEIAADAATMRAPIGPQAGASASPITEAVNGPVATSGASPTPTTPQRVRAAFGAGVQKAGIESSKHRALREFARRLELDNVSAEDALAFAKNNAGKPVAALDLGGGNVAGLARTAKDVPGLGRRLIPDMLNERSAGSGPTEGATLKRVVGDFEKRIGLKPEDYYANIKDMTAKMKAKAKVDYDKVRGLEIDDPEVLSLFDEPEFQAIHERLRTNARLGGKEKINPLFTNDNLGGEEIRTLQPQTLGTLDKVKRQLDKIISKKSDAVGTVDRDQAFNMRERVNTILDRMDELHPDYGKARANYRGSAEGIEAYEAGKTDFVGDDPRLTAQKLAEMPERVRDLYRRGQYDALRTRLSKMDDGSNIGAFLEKNPDIRDKVAALAKTTDESAALRNDLGVERAMGDRKNFILGGPNTAERLIEHASTVPRVTQLGNAARALPGVGKLAGGLVDNAITRRTAEQTGDIMGEVAKIMTRTGPSSMQSLLDEIAALKLADTKGAITTGQRAGRVVGGVVGRAQRPD